MGKGKRGGWYLWPRGLRHLSCVVMAGPARPARDKVEDGVCTCPLCLPKKPFWFDVSFFPLLFLTFLQGVPVGYWEWHWWFYIYLALYSSL